MNTEKTGKLIADLRKEKNLTQGELAELLHVSDKAISRWETGRGFPDINNLLCNQQTPPDLFRNVLNTDIIRPDIAVSGGCFHQIPPAARITEKAEGVCFILPGCRKNFARILPASPINFCTVSAPVSSSLKETMPSTIFSISSTAPVASTGAAIIRMSIAASTGAIIFLIISFS